MAAGEKPYRVYKGGRAKGKVPLDRRDREKRRSFRGDGGGPGKPQVVRRRRWTWRRIVPLTLLVLVAALLIWAVAGYLSVRSGVTSANGRLAPGAAAALQPQGGLILSSPTNILLLGTDHSANGQAGRSSDQHSDSMLLLRTDPGRHRLIYLSIPRDLRAGIPGYGDQKINAAMQLGGPALAVKTVDALFGASLQVNHVVVVDFGDFQKLIDAVGGIDVNVPEKILSNKFDCPFPASQCASWPGWKFRKGVQHMDGHRALIYSRIRENRLDPSWTDFTRGQNQQAVMQATMSKLASVSTFFRLPFDGGDLLAPLATDLSTWDFAQLGWVKFRASASSTLHCRLGGSATTIGGGSYIVGGPENIQVIQEVLGNSAPQPPAPGSGPTGRAASSAARRSGSAARRSVAGGRGLRVRAAALLRAAVRGAAVALGGRFARPRPRGGRALLRLRRLALAVVGRVEARALVVDGHRVEHELDGTRLADVARLGRGRRHRLETLEEMPLGTAVLVDRHRPGKATSGPAGIPQA